MSQQSKAVRKIHWFVYQWIKNYF